MPHYINKLEYYTMSGLCIRASQILIIDGVTNSLYNHAQSLLILGHLKGCQSQLVHFDVASLA